MIVVAGLSHRTAPIAVRERIALPKAEIPRVLTQFVARPAIGEAMLISTCNRVELIVAGKNGPASELSAVGRDAVEGLAALASGVRQHLYVHEGVDAVRHLFRVASSLDSLVLGEPQILGQVKDAFETARVAGTIGGCLHRTVPRAIRAAKRVRTETQLGAGQISVPSVAVDLARQIFGDFRGKTVVLLGSGEMAETVAKLLKTAGTRLLVVGRNEARVGVLAAAVGGEPRGWADLSAALTEADVVITSTSAPGFVVDYDTIHGLRRKRRGRSLFFIDLAVPRDIDPKVESLSEVFLYNIDDFERVVGETRQSRAREAQHAERVVVEEMAGWERWAESTQVTPVVVALRARFSRLLHAELDKSLKGRLKHLGDEDRAALAIMLDAALNKLLHAPTAHLRQVVTDKDFESYRVEQLMNAVAELFELDAEPVSVPSTPSRPAPAPAPDAEGAEPSRRRATGTNGE
ncbi:MAG: glutamyl-tRNA reductase [Myxococcales bacterium]|nr:glutamyl-tRNA reductase [Myxococcales bacterium]